MLLARLGTGAGGMALSTTQLAAISSRAGADERGRMMGLATALTHVGNLAGFVLGGVLASWWTEAGNFALAAATCAFIAVLAVRLERRSTMGRLAQRRAG